MQWHKWLVVGSLALLSKPAGATLPPETRACLTSHVVAFGASVTQATAAVIPGYSYIVDGIEAYGRYHDGAGLPVDHRSPLQTYTPQRFGLSPVRYLVKDLGGASAVRNIEYRGIYFTNKQEDLGSSRIEAMMIERGGESLTSASMIVGVDAFYWDAIWGNCEIPGGAVETIRRLVEFTKAHRVPIVLGTVPFENSTNVRIDSERTGVPGLWYAPMPRCIESINRQILRSCKVQDGCYVIDVNQVAQDLNCGVKVTLKDGRRFGLYEMRPDGVHLSHVGSQYVAEKIERALEDAPPTCRPN